MLPSPSDLFFIISDLPHPTFGYQALSIAPLEHDLAPPLFAALAQTLFFAI